MTGTPVTLTDATGIERFRGTQAGGGGSLPLALPDAPTQPVLTADDDGAAGVAFASLNAFDVNNVGAFVEASSSPAIVILKADTAILLWCALGEPSDSMLNAHGKVLVWLDETNGAAKLMFKTLQADETIVKGSVSLAP